MRYTLVNLVLVGAALALPAVSYWNIEIFLIAPWLLQKVVSLLLADR